MRDAYNLFPLFALIFHPSVSIALHQEPTTTIADNPTFELGGRATTMPIERIDENKLQSKERGDLSGLNTLPGIQVREKGNPTVSVRGSQSSSRILSLIDGIPVSFGDGAGLYSFFVPTETLDSVGILKAPGAHIWGHDSLAGALMFTTKDLASPVLRLRGGSFATTSVFAGTSFFPKPSDGLGQLTAFQQHSMGLQPRGDSETVRGTLKASGKWGLLQVKTSHIAVRQIGSLPQVGPSDAESYSRSGLLSGLTLVYPAGDSLKIGSRTGYRRIDQNYSLTGASRASSWTQGLSVLCNLHPFTIEVFGDSTNDVATSPILDTGGASRSLVDSGVLASLALSSSAGLQLGAHQSSGGGGVLLSAGMNTVTENDVQVFANYSEGYHPPNLFQQYLKAGNFVGNPGLRPEKSSQIDLGMAKNWESTKGGLQFFQRDTKDLIITQGQGAITTNVNLAQALATGGEGTITHSINEWTYGLGLGYLKNRGLVPDQPLELSPQWQGSALLAYEKTPWRASLRQTAWSNYFPNYPGNEAAGWSTTDLAVQRSLSSNIQLELALFNLFNSSYELTTGYPEPGFRAFLSVEGTL